MAETYTSVETRITDGAVNLPKHSVVLPLKHACRTFGGGKARL